MGEKGVKLVLQGKLGGFVFMVKQRGDPRRWNEIPSGTPQIGEYSVLFTTDTDGMYEWV